MHRTYEMEPSGLLRIALTGLYKGPITVHGNPGGTRFSKVNCDCPFTLGNTMFPMIVII